MVAREGGTSTLQTKGCFLSFKKNEATLRRPLAGITAKSASPRALSPAAQSLHIVWASSKPQGLNKNILSTKLRAALFLIESNYDVCAVV